MHKFVRALLVVSIVSAVALAGCAGKKNGATDANGGLDAEQTQKVLNDVNVQATATTGIIRGVVVDDAIRPIEKVQVSVQTGDKTQYANTTVNGAFGFGNLQPGTYFVKAHRAGFSDVQTSVDVKANVADPALARIQMAPDSSFVKPYFTVEQHKGYVECGGAANVPGVVSGTLSACSLVNAAGTIPCGITPVCPGNLTSDDFLQFYNLNPLPDFMVSELVWDSTSVVGNQLDLQYVYDGCTAQLCVANDTQGPSPIQIGISKAQLQDLKLMGGNGTDMGIRIFPATAAETQDTLGVAFQQPFTVYTVATYGFTPPSGYTFSVDGDPKVPLN